MAVLTPLLPSLAGVVSSDAAAAAGGDSFPNDGRTVLYVRNAGGGALNVVAAAVAPCEYGTTHNNTVSCVNGQTTIIGPFPVQRFGESVALTYPGGVTSLFVSPRRIP